MHSNNSGTGVPRHSAPPSTQALDSFELQSASLTDLRSIAHAIELVMTQLLVIEQAHDLQPMQYMARHCWELLYEPRELLRTQVGKRG